MKFLLIGATGMIGSRITAEALSRGHEVTAATRSGRTALPPDPALTVAALDATVPARRVSAAGYDTALIRDAMTQSGQRLTGELTQAGKTVRSTVGNGTVFLTTSVADVSGPRDETVAGTVTGTAEKRARTSPESLPGAFLVRPTEAAGADRRRAMNVATAIIHTLRTYGHPEALVAVPHTSTTATT